LFCNYRGHCARSELVQLPSSLKFIDFCARHYNQQPYSAGRKLPAVVLSEDNATITGHLPCLPLPEAAGLQPTADQLSMCCAALPTLASAHVALSAFDMKVSAHTTGQLLQQRQQHHHTQNAHKTHTSHNISMHLIVSPQACACQPAMLSSRAFICVLLFVSYYRLSASLYVLATLSSHCLSILWC